MQISPAERTLVVLMLAALTIVAGCNSAPTQATSALRVRRIEVRTISNSDLAVIQAKAAEAAAAASETGTGS